MTRTVLRYHLYHPVVCGSRCFAGQEEQRAGLAIHLNRHLAALVTRVQYDLVDERPQNRKPPKVISPSDPSSAWTAKANKRVGSSGMVAILP